MDPIEVIQVCRDAAVRGMPKSVHIPFEFGQGDFQQLWVREHKKVRPILDEIVCAEHADDGLELLYRFGVISALFPELRAIRDLGDGEGSHKDVWTHSKVVMQGVPALVELRWGALLHDIGKAPTRRFTNGRVTFHNHDVVGARMVDSLHARTNIFLDDVALLRTVRHLVLNHLRPAAYKASWSDSAVRRLVTECGDPRFFEKLMMLSRADLTTKSAAKRARCSARADELVRRVAEVIKEDNAPRLPKGTMGLVITTSGRAPGSWLNELRFELERMMLDGRLPIDRDGDFYVAEAMKIMNERTIEGA